MVYFQAVDNISTFGDRGESKLRDIKTAELGHIWSQTMVIKLNVLDQDVVVFGATEINLSS